MSIQEQIHFNVLNRKNNTTPYDYIFTIMSVFSKDYLKKFGINYDFNENEKRLRNVTRTWNVYKNENIIKIAKGEI